MAPGNLEAKQNSRTTGSACRGLRLSLKMDMISWGQKQFNERLKKEKKILQGMEAKAAGERAETSHMREEVAEMVEGVEGKEADLQLLSMLHNQLFVDLLHILEAEERLMEILLP